MHKPFFRHINFCKKINSIYQLTQALNKLKQQTFFPYIPNLVLIKFLTLINMPDRRKTTCTTAEEIAEAKIKALQVREGDPSREDVLRAVLANLQEQFGEQVVSTANKETLPTEVVADELPAAEALSETQQLKALKSDFERGIVQIDLKDADGNPLEGTSEQYEKAKKEDKTAGQTWETIETRLLADDAALLKKAAAMPNGGGRLIGVHDNGELAIRQRSQEIVNARWTEDWEDGDPEEARGDLLLLSHAEAVSCKKGRWAKPVEIRQAVISEGYHVPADTLDRKKKGLVAASEAVTGEDYVRSANGREWRDAILDCGDHVDDDSLVRVVRFYPSRRSTYVLGGDANDRYARRGAVLWLRG